MAKRRPPTSPTPPNGRTRLRISANLRTRYTRIGKGTAKGFGAPKRWHRDFVDKIFVTYSEHADEIARELGWAGADTLDETIYQPTELHNAVTRHLTLHWYPGRPGHSWEREVADQAFDRLDISGLRQKWETIPE